MQQPQILKKFRDLFTVSLKGSKLVELPSGQIIGQPITRRQLKRDTRQARLARRAEFRAAKRDRPVL
jgi:hypothetical protein